MSASVGDLSKDVGVQCFCDGWTEEGGFEVQAQLGLRAVTREANAGTVTYNLNNCSYKHLIRVIS